MMQLPHNGNVKFDGNFSRTEQYLIGGTSLLAIAILNDQLKLINIQTDYNKLLRLGLYTSSILFDAIGDARIDKGFKKNGHLYNAMSVASLLAIPAFTDLDRKDWIKFGASAVMLRFALFDYTYNYTNHLPLDYQGHTSYYDNVVKKGGDFVYWAKGISLITGFVIVF